MKKNFRTSLILSEEDMPKIIYDKVWEFAVDGRASKFAVADALKDRIKLKMSFVS